MIREHIRRAEITDAEALPAIERSAGQAFRQIPDLAWLADEDDLSAEWHRRMIVQGTSWVAVDPEGHPIGFLSAEVVSDELHIWEISVLHERQRAGIGHRLIQRSLVDAISRNLAAITLTTFSHVIWNKPFYERIGFTALQRGQAGPRLDDLLRAETERGLPGDRRCAMRLLITQADKGY
jgi:ribosomal protein S18 acetylase RimI-like enzyme